LTLLLVTEQRGDTDFTTTSTSWVDAETIPVTFPNDGEDIVVWINYELTNANNKGVTSCRVLIDSVERSIHEYKPVGANEYNVVSPIIALDNASSGSHTIQLQLRTSNGSYTAKLRRVHIAVRQR
jgi:hypothetical protein